MGDRPILFSGPMVRALIAGSKTQTRRTIKWNDDEREPPYVARYPEGARIVWCDGDDDVWSLPRAYRVGDRLYVREHWRTGGQHDHIAPRDLPPEWAHPIEYLADGTDIRTGRFRQGMHMPRWASRITLTVTDVRVERLQEISEADAIAEGIERAPYGNWKCYGATPSPFRGAAPTVLSLGRGVVSAEPIHSYATLWEAINGPGAWDANPLVAAYTFTVQMGNIDLLARAS